MKGKIRVSDEFRTSDLSNIKTKNEVHVKYLDGHIRVYDNIHYPNKFINKVFSKNSDVVNATIVNSDGEIMINRTT